MTTNQVANTILEQLGGRQFVVMTGAKNLVAGEASLTMRLGAGAKCQGKTVTHVRVELMPTDTYTMSFLNARGMAYTTIHTVEDVYDQDLRGFFEQCTGLRTSLTAVYA
jgi:hypothetical protein